MEAKIIIKFTRINRAKVDTIPMDSILGYQLLHSTRKTIRQLTKTIEKYFREKNIEVVTDFEVSK